MSDIQQRIAEVLREHAIVPGFYSTRCMCGKRLRNSPTYQRDHAAHVAAVLAEQLGELRLIITTNKELDALPVGSVVMALWDEAPLHHVFQRYSDGWYGFPSESALYPLGSAKDGEAVCVLWIGLRADDEGGARPIRDSDTCGMGDEEPCQHGTRAGRFCTRCDDEGGER